MITNEDRAIKMIVKEKLKEKKMTGRNLSDVLGTSESMVCLLMQCRRRWSQKYIDILFSYNLINKSEHKEMSLLAARSAGYKV
jgi:hypothetical protein